MKICGITKHSYYYKPKCRTNKGIKASTYTKKVVGDLNNIELVNNSTVIQDITKTLMNPDLDYGYRAMTAHLQSLGYQINHKKVYRLMNEHHLLHDTRIKPTKKHVKFRRVKPNSPLEVMEMDIKLEWITSLERYAYIFTVIDCFTRKALYWKAALSIKNQDVKEAWEFIIVNYLQEHDMLSKEIKIEVRNDNDKRFEANIIRDFFTENNINQVFTHPYTPQENGHIESFHAILGRSLERQYYRTLDELNEKLEQFYTNYNTMRLHGSLDYLTPDKFWELWDLGLIEKIERKGKIMKFKLKVKRQSISGKRNLREFPVNVCA